VSNRKSSSELENDTLNQAELNEIKINENNSLTSDVLHITLCVDIISFSLEFSFEFI
jgi:hypothetical protein